MKEKGNIYGVNETDIYGLLKPDGIEFFNVGHMNTNTDIIEGELVDQAKQITDCLGEIGKVKEQITGIDVTTDVEDVVTRLVNTDKSTPLNTLINNVKTAITNSIITAKDATLVRITEINNAIIAHVSSAVNAARDVVTSHVTSQHTTTKGHVTTKVTEINNYTLARANEIKAAINDKPSGVVKSVQRGTWLSTVGTNGITGTVTINISPVNINKSLVILTGTAGTDSGTGALAIAASIESFTSNSIVVKAEGRYARSSSWQVIEFY